MCLQVFCQQVSARARSVRSPFSGPVAMNQGATAHHCHCRFLESDAHQCSWPHGSPARNLGAWLTPTTRPCLLRFIAGCPEPFFLPHFIDYGVAGNVSPSLDSLLFSGIYQPTVLVGRIRERRRHQPVWSCTDGRNQYPKGEVGTLKGASRR